MDVLYPNYLAENRMVHFNENQRWYWLPDQSPNEILVFKAVDSDNFGSSRKSPLLCITFSDADWLACPHGAFPLPSKEGNHPVRESIDVRLLVMYADIVYPESNAWGSA
jgi:hypothetical protein